VGKCKTLMSGLVRYYTYEVLAKEVNNPQIRWAYLPYSMHMAGRGSHSSTSQLNLSRLCSGAAASTSYTRPLFSST